MVRISCTAKKNIHLAYIRATKRRIAVFNSRRSHAHQQETISVRINENVMQPI